MAISPGSRRATERSVEDGVAAQKAEYIARLMRLQDAVTPPLRASELSIGLELDPPELPAGRVSHVSRLLSVAPGNSEARPARHIRAVIDRLIDGHARLCVQQALLVGARRQVLVCEPAETGRLGTDWQIVDLSGRTPGRAAVVASPTGEAAASDDDLDWTGGGLAAPVSVSKPAAIETRVATPAPAARPRKPPTVNQASEKPNAAPRLDWRLATRTLGPGGPSLGALGLGLMRLSTKGRPSEEDAIAVILAALAAGVRFFDTADVYCLDEGDLHHNERLLAEALRRWGGPRHSVIVASKAGLARPGGRWLPSGRPERLMASCEASVAALGEPVDLFQLHALDKRVPFADQVGALVELQARGLVRQIGLSNVDVATLDEALTMAAIASVQNPLSVVDGQAAALLARTAAEEILFIAHSPLGGHRGVKRVAGHHGLQAIGERLDTSPHAVALAWLLAQAPNLVAIPGATQPERAAEHQSALSLTLSPEDQRTLALHFPWTQNAVAANAAAFVPAATLVPDVVAVTVAGTPAPAPAGRREVVLVLGIPAAGKTSSVRPFVDRGFLRLNRDLVGGKLDDLLAPLDAALADGVAGVVLDNTYATRNSRAGVIRVAKTHGALVRVVWMQTSLEDAHYNAALRIVGKYGRLLDPDEIKRLGKTDPNTFPPVVQAQFARFFEPPTLAEGIDIVDEVPFVRQYDPAYTGKALLLDYDGTLRTTKSGAPFPRRPEDVVLLPRRSAVLQGYIDDGYQLFGVSNQAGVALDQLSWDDAQACFARTNALLGLDIPVLFCPHLEGMPTCWCRKPLPGMGVLHIERHQLDVTQTIMVGDRDCDRRFAEGLGVQYQDAEEFFA